MQYLNIGDWRTMLLLVGYRHVVQGLLVVADPSVVFPTHHLRPVAVGGVVAYMPQRGSPCRFAVAGGLQACADIPGEADVDPLLLFPCLLVRFFSGLVFSG